MLNLCNLDERTMSSTNTQQYLLYGALLLGAIGTYGTVESQKKTDVKKSIADLFENGDTAGFTVELSNLKSDLDIASKNASDAVSFIKTFDQNGTSVHSRMKTLEQTIEDLSLSPTDVTQDLQTLTTTVENFTKRVLGVEQWMQNKIDLSRETDTLSGEISLDRFTDTETLVDINSQNLITLTGKVDTNTLDISSFSIDFQGQITDNKEKISNIETQVDTHTSTINDMINPSLDNLETKVVDLESFQLRAETRIDTLESDKVIEAEERRVITDDITDIAERVTTNTVKIDSINDSLEGEFTEAVNANSGNIENVKTALDELLRVVYPTSDNEVRCDGYLRASNGAELFKARIGLSNDPHWMLYRAKPTEDNPLTEGLGFAGWAARIRVYKSRNEGLIVENHNEEALLSIRGDDGLTNISGETQIHSTCSIRGDKSGNALFGNLTHEALMHHSDNGVTVGNTETPYAVMKCRGGKRIEITESRTSLKGETWIVNGSNTNSSVFGANGNFLVTGEGKSTDFRFGKNKTSVSISEGEIKIGNTNVLAKLNSLQDKVDELEWKISNEYVKKGPRTTSRATRIIGVPN